MVMVAISAAPHWTASHCNELIARPSLKSRLDCQFCQTSYWHDCDKNIKFPFFISPTNNDRVPYIYNLVTISNVMYNDLSKMPIWLTASYHWRSRPGHPQTGYLPKIPMRLETHLTLCRDPGPKGGYLYSLCLLAVASGKVSASVHQSTPASRLHPSVSHLCLWYDSHHFVVSLRTACQEIE
jgi:hypothetical protein